MKEATFDILVIGGGAAGTASAIHAARCGLRTALLERGPRLLRKVLVTGSGRCNVSNENASPSAYHGSCASLTGEALELFGVAQTVKFFEEIGLQLKTEAEGKMYPVTDSASSVVDVLRFAADEAGVAVFTDTEVTRLTGKKDAFCASGKDFAFYAKRVIVATGGLAGGAKLGNDGKGYTLLGTEKPECFPALVQLKTEDSCLKSLSGLKTNALVRYGNAEAFDEILFTDYGVSGPAVFAVSRTHGAKSMSIDFLPDKTEEEVVAMLRDRRSRLSVRTVEQLLIGVFHRRIALAILKKAGITGFARLNAELSDEELDSAARTIKKWSITVTGKMPWENAQVTCGGIRRVNGRMESLDREGIYLCGEIIDVDGDCGGYNLQWAWTSAYIAAMQAVQSLRDNV